MHDFVNTHLGWFHFITAMISILAGTYILFKPKGTKLHKQFGYLYVLSMVLVCGSALAVYNITGHFGVFHTLAIAGLFTLIMGLTPVLIKKNSKKNKVLHLWFMYYSVLGLYAAFIAELSLRIPEEPSYKVVGLTSAIVFIIGSIFIFWKEKTWIKYFKEPKTTTKNV